MKKISFFGAAFIKAQSTNHKPAGVKIGAEAPIEPTAGQIHAVMRSAEMPSPKINETDRDFDTIFEAVSATDQGRWFLEELTRRNRNADTSTILDALQALSAENNATLSEVSQAIPPHLAEELGDMSDAIVRFRHTAQQADAQTIADQVPEFLDDLEHHILRSLDFLGVTDAQLGAAPASDRSDILSKLPPELADEAALIDGFEEASPTDTTAE